MNYYQLTDKLLVFINEKKYIIKVIKYLENSGVLLKSTTEENKKN